MNSQLLLIFFLSIHSQGSLTVSAEASLMLESLKKSRLSSLWAGGGRLQRAKMWSTFTHAFIFQIEHFLIFERSDWTLLYGLLLWLKKLGNTLLQAGTFNKLLGDGAHAEQLLPSHTRQEECGCASKQDTSQAWMVPKGVCWEQRAACLTWEQELQWEEYRLKQISHTFKCRPFSLQPEDQMCLLLNQVLLSLLLH